MPTVTTLSGKTVVVDMLVRDFESFRSAILDEGGLADSVTPNWTDRASTDVGVVLVEDSAFMADNLSYMINRSANEALWPSLTQRRSCIEQSALLGYSLSAAVSAQAELTIVTNDSGTLLANQQISTDTSDGSEAKIFELSEDFVASTAGTYTGIIALHGTTKEEVFSSDGSPALSLTLGNKNLALNSAGQSSINVEVQEGVLLQSYSEVSNYQNSEETDRHFVVSIDEEDVITITFGNGIKGFRPPSGTNNIFVSFRVGGGEVGNEVGPNTITEVSNAPIWIASVTNPEIPTGGSPKETIEEAKVNAPASLVAMDRCLTHADYEAVAQRIPGVARAKAYRGSNAPLDEHVVIASKGLNPVPTGTWDPFTEVGTGLLGSVGTYLSARKCVPTTLYVEAVDLVPAWLTIEVYLLPTVRRRTAKKAIENALNTNFQVQNFLMGVQMAESNITSVVEDTVGVDYLNILRFQRQPYGKKVQGAENLDLTIDDIQVNALTAKDEWIIEFTSATEFAVKGMASGVQPSGIIGTSYAITNGSLKFRVNEGSVPPALGSRYEIITGPYVGNMDPTDFEACYLKSSQFFMTLKGGRE
jgi:hypothetical protein